MELSEAQPNSPSWTPASEAEKPGFEPRFATARDLLYVLFKYRRLILGVFFGVVLSVYSVISIVPEKFDAAASLLVQLGRENAAVPVTVMRESFIQGGVRAEDVNSEIAALRSPELIAETIDEIGIARFKVEPPLPTTLFGWVKFVVRTVYRGAKRVQNEILYLLNLRVRLDDRQGAISIIGGSLDVNSVAGSNVITVALRLSDPSLGADIVNTLVRRHLLRRSAYLGQPKAAALFRQAVKQREEELAKADQALVEFREKTGITSITDQRALALQELRIVEERTQQARVALSRTQAELAARSGSLKKVPAGVAARNTTKNPVGEHLAGRLAELRAERSRKVGTFREDSRFVEELDAEIASVGKQMREKSVGEYGFTTTEVNPNRQVVEQKLLEANAQLAGLSVELEEQREQEAAVRSKLARFDELEGRARELERGRGLAEEALMTYARKAEQAQMVDEMTRWQFTNLAILSLAQASIEPAWPRKMFLMGIALFVGLLGGIGAAFAADAVDRSVRYGGDLIRRGIPLLATVPSLDGGFRTSPMRQTHARH